MNSIIYTYFEPGIEVIEQEEIILNEDRPTNPITTNVKKKFNINAKFVVNLLNVRVE